MFRLWSYCATISLDPSDQTKEGKELKETIPFSAQIKSQKRNSSESKGKSEWLESTQWLLQTWSSKWQSTADQYRFEFCIFRRHKSKAEWTVKREIRGGKKIKRVLLKYRNNLTFTLKQSWNSPRDWPGPVCKKEAIGESLKQNNEKRRNKSRNKNFCSIFKFGLFNVKELTRCKLQKCLQIFARQNYLVMMKERCIEGTTKLKNMMCALHVVFVVSSAAKRHSALWSWVLKLFYCYNISFVRGLHADF